MKSKFTIEIETEVLNAIEYAEDDRGSGLHKMSAKDRKNIDEHFHKNFAKSLQTSIDWNDWFQENILDGMGYEGHNFGTIFKDVKIQVKDG